MGPRCEKLVLGKNGSLVDTLISLTQEEEGGAEGGAGGRFFKWMEGRGTGGGNGFFTETTEGPALTSAAGISIQPWKCPLSLLTCEMNVLPYKLLMPYQTPTGHLDSMRGLGQPASPM